MPYAKPKEHDVNGVTASRALSERQSRILAFIWHYTVANSFPPSLREIVEGCDISSISVVDYNLRRLEKNGYLTRTPMACRTIVLTERGRSEVLTNLYGCSQLDPVERTTQRRST